MRYPAPVIGQSINDVVSDFRRTIEELEARQKAAMAGPASPNQTPLTPAGVTAATQALAGMRATLAAQEAQAQQLRGTPAALTVELAAEQTRRQIAATEATIRGSGGSVSALNPDRPGASGAPPGERSLLAKIGIGLLLTAPAWGTFLWTRRSA